MMINRRILFKSGAARFMMQFMTPPVQVADASSEPAIFQQDLPAINLEDWIVTAQEVTFPPGLSASPHQHPGFVIGYVLQGEFQFQMEGQPKKILSAGQMFYEPPGLIHCVARSADETKQAKILALVFHKKGTAITMIPS